MIAAVVAGLVSWFLPRPPVLPVRVRLDGSEGPGFPLAFSPDGLILATGHLSGNIQLWDQTTGKLRSTLIHREVMDLGAVFSPDSRKIAVRGTDLQFKVRTITVFEVETGRELTRISVPGPVVIPSMWFAPDGSTLNLIRWDNLSGGATPFHFFSWDTATWGRREDRPLPLKRHDIVAVSKDGRTLAAGDFHAPQVTLWDVDSGRQLTSLTVGKRSSPAGVWVWSLGFSPDGSTLAVGRDEGELELWDLHARSLRASLRWHSPGYAPQGVVFGPGRERLISAGMDRGVQTYLAQLMTGVGNLFRPRGAARIGRELRPGEIILGDVASRRPRVKLGGETWPLLSPDGKTMATRSPGGSILLRDVPSESHR